MLEHMIDKKRENARVLKEAFYVMVPPPVHKEA